MGWRKVCIAHWAECGAAVATVHHMRVISWCHNNSRGLEVWAQPQGGGGSGCKPPAAGQENALLSLLTRAPRPPLQASRRAHSLQNCSQAGVPERGGGGTKPAPRAKLGVAGAQRPRPARRMGAAPA